MKKIIKSILAIFSAIAMASCSQAQGGRMDRRKIVKDTSNEIKANAEKDTVTAVKLSDLDYFEGEKERNETISVKNGVAYIIAKTNPSTGYDWEVKVETEDSTILRLDKSYDLVEERESSQPMMCGAPTTRKYDFITEKPGSAKIIFEYKRPWGKQEPEATVVYNITITD